MAYLPDEKAPPQTNPSDPGALIDMPWRDANGVWHIGSSQPAPYGPGLPNFGSNNPPPPAPTTPPVVPPPAPPGSVTTPPDGLVPPGGFSWMDLFKAGAPFAALLPFLTSMSNNGMGPQAPGNFFQDNQQLQSLLNMSATRAERTDPLHQAVTQLAMSRLPTNMQR